MTPTEAFKLLLTFKKIVDFFETGSVATVYSDIEFAAANKALSEIPMAFDKRGQVLIAIGHLNSCYEANKHIILSSKSVWKPETEKRDILIRTSVIKARIALCMIALCYAFLNDKDMAERHFDLVLNTKQDHEFMFDNPLKLAATLLYLPAFCFEIPIRHFSGMSDSFRKFETENYIKDHDLKEMREQVLALL